MQSFANLINPYFVHNRTQNHIKYLRICTLLGGGLILKLMAATHLRKKVRKVSCIKKQEHKEHFATN